MSMLRGKWSMRPLGLLSVGLLGASTALLVACGSSGKLIPVANSEPLQKDFEEVARAAENGHGGCSSTEAALNKADHDFAGLPASVDAGLRRRLGEGLSKLRADALELCLQPAAGATTATSAPTTSAPAQTSTGQPPPATTNTQTAPNTTTTTAPGGGTPAKEGEPEAEAGGSKPKEKGKVGEGGGDTARGGGREAGK